MVSAHRTPDLLFDYAAKAATRGLKAIIAGAGGAAHLPGMLGGEDSGAGARRARAIARAQWPGFLALIVQMPAGVRLATFAIGKAGATNAALFAAAVLALEDEKVARALADLRAAQTEAVLSRPDPRRQ